MSKVKRIRNRKRRIEVVDWPGVRFRRYASAESVVRAFLGGSFERPGHVIGGWGRTTGKDMVTKARRMGAWGYCTHAGNGTVRATVHWWARRKMSADRIFELLFHECLHAVLTAHGMHAHRQMEPFEALALRAFRATRQALAQEGGP